MSEMAKIVQSY